MLNRNISLFLFYYNYVYYKFAAPTKMFRPGRKRNI